MWHNGYITDRILTGQVFSLITYCHGHTHGKTIKQTANIDNRLESPKVSKLTSFEEKGLTRCHETNVLSGPFSCVRHTFPDKNTA